MVSLKSPASKKSADADANEAIEVYKVENEESLEAILLALHLPADQVAVNVNDVRPHL